MEPLQAKDGGRSDSGGYNGRRSKLYLGIGSQGIHPDSIRTNLWLKRKQEERIVTGTSASTVRVHRHKC